MKIISSLRQKIYLIFIGVLIAILLTEVILRIGGLIAHNVMLPDSKGSNDAESVILCVGDSSTYGLGASNTNKFSYPAQLQTLLNEKVPNNKFNVINIGVPGMNSSQVLHRFKDNLLEYKPDIVVMMIGINDPWNLEENDILKHYNETNLGRRALLSLQLLLNKLRVYQFIKLIYISTEFKRYENTSLHNQELTLPDFDKEALSKGFAYSMRNPAKATALYHSISNNIIAMKQIAEEKHILIIFMTFHNAGWGRPDKIINDTYATLNVPVVDQLFAFEKAKELGLNIRSRDHWHPNDFGYLLMARNIFNKLVDLKIVDSEPVAMFE